MRKSHLGAVFGLVVAALIGMATCTFGVASKPATMASVSGGIFGFLLALCCGIGFIVAKVNGGRTAKRWLSGSISLAILLWILVELYRWAQARGGWS